MRSYLFAAALLLVPALAHAGDSPSERAQAERRRTIERKAERRTTFKKSVARRNAETAATQREQAATAAAAQAERLAQIQNQRLFDAAVQGGMAQAYRTNPYLGGGSGFGLGAFNTTPGLGVYNPANSAVNVGVPGTNNQVGVVSYGQGVSFVPAGPKHPNPVGINK